MTRTVPPRVVTVTRPTEYEDLLARHGTRAQVSFFLERRGLGLEEVEVRHRRHEEALQKVNGSIPLKWRRTRVYRHDLSRFLFEPADLIVAVGQDGLVANVAKYLEGQSVIGVNPDPRSYDGVLVSHAPDAVSELLEACHKGRAKVQERTMVGVQLDDGQQLVGLNELFLGHRTHQSARYRVRWRSHEERHSSSGLIAATGTGATGWALSIGRQRGLEELLPAPSDRELVFLVREPFPSVTTRTELSAGVLAEGESLVVVSEMNDGGVIFGDGIEADRLDFTWGKAASVSVAPERLRLVVG